VNRKVREMVESRKSRVERRREARSARRETGSEFRQRPALSRRSPRRAISLTEVLISMGILTVGLLGVAALFPVGGFYMQKAEVADRGSAIAQAVMSDIVARGMLNPGSWFVMVPPNRPGPEYASFPSDGKLSPVPLGQLSRETFTRPYALTLGEALEKAPSEPDPAVISKQFGNAVVIDPMGVAAMAFPDQTSKSWHGISSVFPASAYLIYPNNDATWNSLWGAWGQIWPVRRATFRDSSTGWQMYATAAEHYFRGNDELGTDLPARDDRPARQNWDIADSNGSPLPLARQWQGDYSWLVTVVPTTNAARNGLARNPEGHSYDVSVVVFYKRVLPPGAVPVAQTSSLGVTEFRRTMGRTERAVRARILSTGLNGGEVVLEAMTDGISESAFQNLRTGQWIMLCGPHPNSTSTDPRFVLNWYQVLSIEGRDARLNSNGTQTPPPAAGEPERRVVALRGPQWPWNPSDYVSDYLCGGIFGGAVAVHTKTMRLESPRSSPVKFGSSGSHTTIPLPWEWE
jgi:hypothetical protein